MQFLYRKLLIGAKPLALTIYGPVQLCIYSSAGLSELSTFFYVAQSLWLQNLCNLQMNGIWGPSNGTCIYHALLKTQSVSLKWSELNI